jgi:hypothetical protein
MCVQNELLRNLKADYHVICGYRVVIRIWFPYTLID